MENTPPPNSPPGNSTSSGANLLDLPKGLNPQSLQKRPSIAPVPAFIEGNAIDIQVRFVDIFQNRRIDGSKSHFLYLLGGQVILW